MAQLVVTGHPDAVSAIGEIDRGLSNKLATTWLEKALDWGSIQADFELGMLYQPDGADFWPDSSKAIFHLERFLQRNSTKTTLSRITKYQLSLADYHLGNTYYQGKGKVKQDEVKAARHYKNVLDSKLLNDKQLTIAKLNYEELIPKLSLGLVNQQVVNMNTTATGSSKSKNAEEKTCSVM